ncbi:MAG: hypothetical protein J5494_07040 [Candidatus Methanomethylophilaceae archaeon]|nr:hypothetical protein [Candidatus Methanomethylophilaceae archaeon]
MSKVRRAIISVSDKNGIVDFAKALSSLGTEIISTGGTYKLLKENGVPAKEVSDIVVANSDENDKIIVLGINDIIYLLSHREASSKYSYQKPILLIDPERKEEFLTDMRKLETKIIVTGKNSEIKEYIKDLLLEHYTPIGTIGQLEIYKKS